MHDNPQAGADAAFALPDHRLIALSGHDGEHYIEQARQAGFDEYLLKPINTERLELLLSELAAGRCGLPAA